MSDPAPTELSWSAEEGRTPSGEGARLLVFAGDLDLATVPEFERAVADPAPRLVVFDMRGVRFVDSSGIHAIVRARLERAAGDGEVQIVVSPDSAVERVLRMSGLEEELSPHADSGSALAAFGEEASGP